MSSVHDLVKMDVRNDKSAKPIAALQTALDAERIMSQGLRVQKRKAEQALHDAEAHEKVSVHTVGHVRQRVLAMDNLSVDRKVEGLQFIVMELATAEENCEARAAATEKKLNETEKKLNETERKLNEVQATHDKNESDAVIRQLAFDVEYNLKKVMISQLEDEQKAKFMYKGNRLDVGEVRRLPLHRRLEEDSMLKAWFIKFLCEDDAGYDKFFDTIDKLKTFSRTGAHPTKFGGQEINGALLDQIIDRSTTMDEEAKRLAKVFAKELVYTNASITAKQVQEGQKYI